MLLSVFFGTFLNSKISVVHQVVSDVEWSVHLPFFFLLRMHGYFLEAASSDIPYLVWTLNKWSFGQIFKWFPSLLKLIKSQPKLRNKKSSPKQVHFLEVLFRWSFFLLVATQPLPSENSLLEKADDCWLFGWRHWWGREYMPRSFDVTFTCRRSWPFMQYLRLPRLAKWILMQHKRDA